jgi:hypothetical protein
MNYRNSPGSILKGKQHIIAILPTRESLHR